MANGYNDIMGGIPGMGNAAQNAAISGVGATPQFNLSGQAGAANVAGAVPAVAGANAGAAAGPGFFQEGGMAQMGLGAIQTLGSLWNTFQQNKIAKKSLALQEKAFETNLANQTKTYNTELEDRIRTRYAAEGREEGAADTYIEKNRL